MIKKFSLHTILFLIPVVIGYGIVEQYTRNLPLTPKIKSDYLNIHKDDIETLVLGASQNRDAINPEFLSSKTINLAHPDQDYHVSYKVITRLSSQLPKLKTVIIPISYGHFETAPKQTDTWKNSMYKHYYDVTVSDKFTYFKDHLLYLSFPNYYSTKIKEHRRGISTLDFNDYVYNNDISYAKFYKLQYDSLRIIKSPIHSTPEKENPSFVSENAEKLYAILEHCTSNGYQPLLVITPTTRRFRDQHISNVARRRDSILSHVQSKYDILLLDAENGDHYKLTDYRDDNHLSPSGAQLFTKQLNTFLEKNSK